MRELYIAVISTVVIAGATGCGNNDSTPPTKQEIASFKGHQPTPEQMKEAMTKARSSGPKGPPSAPK